ncbi:MAG: hypothetical protein AAGD07_13535 [Planctomycetota bacterium]
MADFFVKTETAIAGPFTGVEVREASLAGVLRPETLLSNTTRGPWVRAEYAGLFTEMGKPVPHPPDVHVPRYAVRGMPGAFMGPFKLRELIGFATRGMLPPHVELKSAEDRPWVSIEGFGILRAGLRGELALLDASGNVVLMTKATADSRSNLCPADEGLRSPIEIARSIEVQGATAMPSQHRDAFEPLGHEVASVSRPSEKATSSPESDESSLDQRRRVRDVLRSIPASAGTAREAVASPMGISVLAGLVTIGLFVMGQQWLARRQIQRAAVIGEWFDIPKRQYFSESLDEELTSGGRASRFAIRFANDGRCVLFNSQGLSWSGDFDWELTPQTASVLAPPATGSNVRFLRAIKAGHEQGIVSIGDGLIRLRGFIKTAPTLDGITSRSWWVRMKDGQLQLGYTAEIEWTDQGKQILAGWISAAPWTHQEPRSDASEPSESVPLQELLAKLPSQQPVDPKVPDGTPSLSNAIERARSRSESVAQPIAGMAQGSPAFSNTVDAGYLIEHHGPPDEARQLFPFEIATLNSDSVPPQATLARYGSLGLILDDTGDLRHILLKQ